MTTLETADQPNVLKAVQQVSQIATLPEITCKIIQIVEDPKSAAKDLRDVITHDVALSAKILKVVNSAFYGLPRQVSSVDRAIVLLGLSTVKNIAIATSVAKMFAGKRFSGRFSPRDLWHHSLACGVFCKMMTKAREIADRDELFVAGLMHDLGILVENQVFPQKFAEAIDAARNNHVDLCQAETEIIGADHQAFGTALTNKWKFPTLFQLATGYHHQPLKASAEHQQTSAAVHLADALAHQKQVGFSLETCRYEQGVLEVLGITEQTVEELLDGFDENFADAQVAIT